MVDPASDRERSAFLRKVKVGFVGLVGLSGGLMGLQAGAPLTVVALVTVIGLIVGLALVWMAFPTRSDLSRGGRRFR